MRARHRRTLERLFSQPTPANIRWREVVALMDALDMEMYQRAGSRVTFKKGALRLMVHRPHPRPELKQNTVREIAKFLEKAGVRP